MKPHQLMTGDNPHHWITQKYKNLSPGAFPWPVYKVPAMTDRMLRNQSRWLACIKRANIERLRHRGNRNAYGFFDRYC